MISRVEEPLYLLGGWAVYILVNDGFRKVQHRSYLGSRDIDLGFHMDLKWNKEELRQSTLAKLIEILEKGFGFRTLNFRLIKEFHIIDGKELDFEKAKQVPSPFLFPLYVDPLVDNIHPQFKEVIKLNALDEPLLKFVFENKQNRIETKEFGGRVWIPKPDLLLAMKLRSIVNRDKEHKKIKDACDIFSLLWYTGVDLVKIREDAEKFISQEDINKGINSITKQIIENCSLIFNIPAAEIKDVLNKLV